jgi:predicted dehydrogenase
LRILIAGLGSIGRRHLRNLRQLGQEDIVLLRTRTSTLPDAELAGLPVEADIHDALERWHPQAVVVATPTSKHLDVAIPAADAGCHLLIEKPLSHSLEGIKELRQAVGRGGGRVLVGFQFRFHPGLQAAKRLLDEGAIGRPLSARVEWGEYLPDWHPWEDYRRGYSARADLGGGVTLTLCHPFDYLRWLLGEVTGVCGTTARLGGLDIDVEDTAEVVLLFSGSAVASVHLDYLRRPACHRLEVIGTQGCLQWNVEEVATRWWSASAQTWQTSPERREFDRNSMFLEEARHFVAVGEGSAEPICGLEDGVRALEIAVAARASSIPPLTGAHGPYSARYG